MIILCSIIRKVERQIKQIKENNEVYKFRGEYYSNHNRNPSKIFLLDWYKGMGKYDQTIRLEVYPKTFRTLKNFTQTLEEYEPL